ncbi:MAG: hypothetical protein DRP09_20155 [Candidatus Thorarchaeota archaeon]|nr:MAG: hypothetical protein DRP09_20155 [Candidatus Thorarchaeota archaeon]
MNEKKNLRIYIASPLFSQMEKEFNLKINNLLQSLGFETYLPQLDGGLCSDLIKNGMPKKDARKYIFEKDLEAIKNCDIFLFILDGRVPDEGACVELGIAYTLGKVCVGFKTDCRSLIDGDDSLMIEGCLQDIATNFSELKEILQKIRYRFKRGELK